MKTTALLLVAIVCDVTQTQIVNDECTTDSYQHQNQGVERAHASTDRQDNLRYQGCFNAGPSGMLNGRYFQSYNMTHEMCFSFCERWLSRFAGIQEGAWCTCGNSYSRREHKRQSSFQCSIPCPGSNETSYQWCGGFRRVSLFTLR